MEDSSIRAPEKAPSLDLLPRASVVSIPVHEVSLENAARQIIKNAHSRTPSYVCVANVHMTMEANDDPDFQQVVSAADLVVPDGMPLVWMLRMLGHKGASRVRGPDLMLRVVELAAEENLSIGLYGGSEETLRMLSSALDAIAPKLTIAAAISPPFRELSADEEGALVQELIDSGARVIFAGLGCPKQEKWMARQRGAIHAPLVGVGAAFDFHAGRISESPRWLQNAGLEWLYRLSQEPRRLWRRYLYHNPRFLWLAAQQLFK